MESIRQIYKIGYGPSSSHTMGPRNAARIFKERNPDATSFQVELYGSLAATGVGHMTDVAIEQEFSPKTVKIVWKPEIELPFHPNGMIFHALDENNQTLNSWTIYSIGGGNLADENTKSTSTQIYDKSTMSEILEWCQQTGKTFWEYVIDNEGVEIFDYLKEVWNVMKAAIEKGLEEEGILPGGLGLQRKASSYYVKGKGYQGSMRSRALVFSYALATSEENAAGGKIVTAPTCGSCGTLPAVLYHLHNSTHAFSETKIIRALATAGLIGNIVKTNASISGAEVGCQGEIGVACAMASAAGNQLFGGSPAQIEYAAEMGLEHHLGLTCDPVCGLVQVPCIERNAFAAVRALDSCSFAMLSDGKHLVSFDKVVQTMQQTGHDLPSLYRETSSGGLALYMKKKN
ncbi:L-serine ammonia-lyase [Dysgonomonas sp. 520]|uniref:L-serine ammonia-lyase n=1 Tax=Dysgonomonas sp. 520 TaxID=2302931 RepID=UPI0013D03038|nr:L-serine ammonia-lyase [Dysgonomonas sp. 520]NDW09914.1 L-serine ammonia-lyase [Dysgonomonas sp. 520]